MEMMGRLDRASGLFSDDDFSAKLPSAQTGDFKRIPGTPEHVDENARA
jgi:hypothetical protein